MEKIRIRDKHPGSATLPVHIFLPLDIKYRAALRDVREMQGLRCFSYTPFQIPVIGPVHCVKKNGGNVGGDPQVGPLLDAGHQAEPAAG